MAGSPLCGPASSQLARDRERQGYVFSWRLPQGRRGHSIGGLAEEQLWLKLALSPSERSGYRSSDGAAPMPDLGGS
jgi:hypothetical protein